MANRQPAAPAAYRGQAPPVHQSPSQPLLQGQGHGAGHQHLPPTPNQPYPHQVPQPLPPPQQPVHPTTSPMTPSPTPPPESSAAGNVAPTIPLQDPVQLPQQITTAMHSITDRLDILIAGMGQMFQLPLQALAYQLPQQAQPQLQAIPNQPTQPPPPQPTAPTAPVASTPPPATPGATSTASTQVEPPHTSHRRSRSTTHRHHKSTRRSRTRSHRRRRSPRSQHRQRGPTARSDHHPSKTTSRSVRLIPNPRGPTPYDAFSEKTQERRPLSRPHRRQHRDMDVRNWREEEQPEEPSESATPAQSTQDYQNRAEAAQEANYRKQILKAKEDGRRCRALVNFGRRISHNFKDFLHVVTSNGSKGSSNRRRKTTETTNPQVSRNLPLIQH